MISGFLGSLGSVVIVLVAFSALVFVHELGHFLAALYVGVRVERFYIGFDAWGMAIRRTINGVECGIGILPLGGYVKLAGQADDPREEKLTGAPDELRSKSLPAQALVFVAGVVMNFIFGFIILTIAYMHGISFVPPVIGEVFPDSPAARAGLEPGDRVTHVNGEQIPSFERLQNAIVGRPGEVLQFTIEREGEAAPLTLRIKGEQDLSMRGEITTIGVSHRRSRRIAGVVDHPAYRYVANVFQIGDELLSIDGTEIPEHGGLQVQGMVEDRPLDIVVAKVLRDGSEQTLSARVIPVGMYDTGFRFAIRCSQVIPGTPAERAGLKSGDRIYAVSHGDSDEKIRFRKVEDLIDAVKAAGLRTLDVQLRRGDETLWVEGIEPRSMRSDERIPENGDTMLGLVMESDGDATSLTVKSVLDDGPAAGQVQAGDTLLALRPSGEADSEALALDSASALLPQVDAVASAPLTFHVLKNGRKTTDETVAMRITPTTVKSGVPRIGIQLGLDYIVTGIRKTTESGEPTLASRMQIPVGARVWLLTSPDLVTTFVDYRIPGQERQRTLQLTPMYVRDDPLKAGFKGMLPIVMDFDREARSADSLPAALGMAGRESVEMALTVYNFIGKLATQKIHISAAGGPISVFSAIKTGSETGLGYLLWIVAFISINLAVFNLLPLPVLDGGHMLFLGIEAVAGRPPGPRLREISQYVGILCLLALMITVTGIDIFYALFR